MIENYSRDITVNARSLTRGDTAVGGAALLLFIFSFIPYYDAGGDQTLNSWDTDLFPLLPSVYLLGVIAAALIIIERFLPQPKVVAGMKLSQWGTAFAVAVAWTALWTQFSGLIDHAWGSFVTLLLSFVLAGAAIAAQLVPALGLPLTSARPPQQGQFPGGQPGQFQQPGQQQPGGWQQPQQQQQGFPQGQQPGQPQQQGGYGFPGNQSAPQQPQQPQAGYGFPHAAPTAQAPQVHQPQMQQPQMQQPAQQAPADPNFAPFWFAVPDPRPLMPEDGSHGAPVSQLTPGAWHLALEQRGGALLVEEQTEPKRRGLLINTEGLQRG
jgi:hypothetical protein